MAEPAPEVSVLLAVHNGASSLGDALNSLRTQSLDRFEVVVVDDGSTDASGAIAAAVAAVDARFLVFRNEHRMGLAASLNRAFAASRGELIARLDADDIALPRRLERQRAFLQNHPEVAILGSAALVVDVEGRTFGTREMPERHELLFKQRLLRNPVIHPTVMMRRSVMEQLDGYDPALQRAQDYDLWQRAFRAGFRFHNLQEPLIKYRLTAPSWRAMCCGAYQMARWAARERRFAAAVVNPMRLFAAALRERLRNVGRSAHGPTGVD